MSDLPANPIIKPTAPQNTFRYFCQKVLPAVYDDSLSYYELLCKLTDKINEIISGDQSQVLAIEELQRLYNSLRQYIENLDLTDEVETALEKMGDDGELANIMALYLNSINVFGFKTIAEMKQSSTLGNGSICKLLGQTNYQTGDGSYYLIRDRLPTDVIDDDDIILITAKPTCVAEKIPDYYIDNLTTTVGNLSDSLTNLSTLHTLEVGDLNNLNTTSKSNLVSAINETNSKTIPVTQGGTGGTTTDSARTNLDVYSKSETDTQISTAIAGLGTVFNLKGSVATVTDLPNTNNSVGDVYYVEDQSVGYIWINDNGTYRWEQFGEVTDTSDFVTKSGLLTTTGNATNNTMTQSAITTNLNLKANTADLATVATSGLYADLSGSPTQLTDFTGTLPINQGGTGATTALSALQNFGISDVYQMDFSANDYSSWVTAVQTYVDNNLQTRRPFVFNAGWDGTAYGSGLAYQTLDTGYKFLILSNTTTEDKGVRFYGKQPGSISQWTEMGASQPYTLYSNTSGTTGTITLSDDYDNYSKIGVYAQGQYNNDAVYQEICTNVNYMTLSATSSADTNYNCTVCRSAFILFNGNLITFDTNCSSSYHATVGYAISTADGLKITKVIGYK